MGLFRVAIGFSLRTLNKLLHFPGGKKLACGAHGMRHITITDEEQRTKLMSYRFVT